MIKSLRFTDWRPSSDGDGKVRGMLYTLPDGREVTFKDLPVGAMWYWSQVPGHPPEVDSLCVVLPGKTIWYMHHPGSDGCMWNIKGTAPKVTASPSINIKGIYHGFVTDGVVSNDHDGRKFGQDGKQIR